MRSFFDMDDGQGTCSDLPVFATHVGLRDIHFNAIVTRKLDDRWAANGSLTVARLRGDAADNPIIQRRQQTTAIVSLTY